MASPDVAPSAGDLARTSREVLSASQEARFAALAEAFVPEARALDAEGWARVLGIVDDALADRDPGVRRQLGLFLRLLDVLAVFRHGRRLGGLSVEDRSRLLRKLQDGPILKARQGVWGLRTLAFMGYYARPEVHAEIGYRGHPDGWERHRHLEDEAGVGEGAPGPASQRSEPSTPEPRPPGSRGGAES